MVFVAADQFGVSIADAVDGYCESRSIEVKRIGSRDESDTTSLESLVPELVDLVRSDPESSGILICGTGVGVEIGANRFAGIRASLCSNRQTAEWARQYDNANVLCLSGWDTDPDELPSILDAWFTTKFDGDESRMRMLSTFDAWAGK